MTIQFVGGPFDGAATPEGVKFGEFIERTIFGQPTVYVYQLFSVERGLRYFFKRAYRQATQECQGK